MEFKSNTPIYLQVIEDIKSKIIVGEIKPGEKLPSSRELAVMYDINPNTAARIYTEMERVGISYTKRGIGTFVTDDKKVFDEMKTQIISGIVYKFVDDMRSMGYDDKSMEVELKKYLTKENLGKGK